MSHHLYCGLHYITLTISSFCLFLCVFVGYFERDRERKAFVVCLFVVCVIFASMNVFVWTVTLVNGVRIQLYYHINYIIVLLTVQ